MKILICSIIRNRAFFIRRYYFLLRHLVSLDKENQYDISIFENDSQDGTDNWIQALDWSFFNKKYIFCKTCNMPFLSDSSQHSETEERVKILSWARNEAINQVGENIKTYDKILFLETECLFYPKDIINLINLSKNTDIYSPKSIMEQDHMIGDSWATRINQEDLIYNGDISINKNNDYFPLWSTYSYLCIYNAKPIIEGARFGFINERLNKPDCDTVVICEEFRKKGYNKIFMNTNILVSHI